MAKGKLRCVGSSIYLKNKFGTGYRVNAISTNNQLFIDQIHTHWPEMKLAEADAASLQFE
jgi:hypothetical protein